MKRQHLIVSALIVGFGILTANAQCPGFKSGFEDFENGFSGSARGFTVWDDGTGLALYVGGNFSADDGVERIAKWTGSDWQPLETFNGIPYRLFVHDDGTGETLWAAGSMRMSVGDPIDRIGKWDGTKWVGIGGGFNGTVYGVAVWDDGTGPALYAGGSFTEAGGQPASRLAKWDGTSWTEVGGGVSDRVYDLEVFDDGTGEALYLTGIFDDANGIPINRIAKWDGASFSPLATGIGGTGLELQIFDDGSGEALYVCGQIGVTVGSDWTRLIARWDGTSWSNVGGKTTDYVWCEDMTVFDDGTGPKLVLSAGGVYIGGGGNKYLPMWDGSSWTSLAPAGSPDDTRAIFADTSQPIPTLWVSGNFHAIDWQLSDGIALYSTYCATPVITDQPVGHHGDVLSGFVLTARAIGDRPMTYQWRKDGVPLIDGPPVYGSQTDEIQIVPVTSRDAGIYDLEVTNAAGSVKSVPVLVTLDAVDSPPSSTFTTIVSAPYDLGISAPEPEYVFFRRAVCSTTGEVTFRTTNYHISPHALIQHDGVRISRIMGRDDQAPGMDDGVYFRGSVFDFDVGPNGIVAFSARVDGPGIDDPNDFTIWVGDPSGISLVAQESGAAPGMSPGQVFDRFRGYAGMEAPRMTESGRPFFFGETSGPDGDIDGVWTWDAGGGTTPWGIVGDPAPGTDAQFTSFFRLPRSNATGTVLAVATIESSVGGAPPDSGIWLGDGTGPTHLILRSGDPAPGAPRGSVFSAFDHAQINAAGDIAFKAFIEDPADVVTTGIYRISAGDKQPKPVMLRGDPVPPAVGSCNLRVFALDSFLLSDSGMVVFPVRFGVIFDTDASPPTVAYQCPGETIVAAIPGEKLVPVLRESLDSLPGLLPGYELGGFPEWSFISVNAKNQIMLQCNVRGPSGSYTGVFGWTPGDGLFPILTPGTEIELPSGGLRVISYASLGTQGSERHAVSPNLRDDGTFVLNQDFTGPAQAIVIGQFDRFRNAEFCFADLTTQGPAQGERGFGVPDGIVTAGDIGFYINAWIERDAETADLTSQNAPTGDTGYGVPDGQITADDINYYVNGWVVGCP